MGCGMHGVHRLNGMRDARGPSVAWHRSAQQNADIDNSYCSGCSLQNQEGGSVDPSVRSSTSQTFLRSTISCGSSPSRYPVYFLNMNVIHTYIMCQTLARAEIRFCSTCAIVSLTNSAMMNTLTAHCQWEDETVRKRTGHPLSYAVAKKVKSLTPQTNGCLRAIA